MTKKMNSKFHQTACHEIKIVEMQSTCIPVILHFLSKLQYLVAFGDVTFGDKTFGDITFSDITFGDITIRDITFGDNTFGGIWRYNIEIK